MIAPLTKEKGDGSLYTRPEDIEKKLHALANLPRDELLARAQIRARTDPGYVPSECLLYFVRASRNDNSDAWFEQLYKLLSERVERALPAAEDHDGATASLMAETIHNDAFGRFVKLLAEDRQTPADKLDFFEVRFNLGIKRLRLDAQEKAWREGKRSATLEDEESGELRAEVETAAGAFDPTEFDAIDDPLFMERLEAAIDALPEEQSRTLHMLRLGFPIDSDEPDAMTIAKALGKTGRTISNYRDRAIKSLRVLFTDGEEK